MAVESRVTQHGVEVVESITNDRGESRVSQHGVEVVESLTATSGLRASAVYFEMWDIAGPPQPEPPIIINVVMA